jgi:hypothetical protein
VEIELYCLIRRLKSCRNAVNAWDKRKIADKQNRDESDGEGH